MIITNKHFTLMRMFANFLRKHDFDVEEYEIIDVLQFENKYIKGMINFDKERKVNRVRWTTNGVYEILDIPMNNGAVSTEFKKPTDLLDFLKRRLIWKTPTKYKPVFVDPRRMV